MSRQIKKMPILEKPPESANIFPPAPKKIKGAIFILALLW